MFAHEDERVDHAMIPFDITRRAPQTKTVTFSIDRHHVANGNKCWRAQESKKERAIVRRNERILKLVGNFIQPEPPGPTCVYSTIGAAVGVDLEIENSLAESGTKDWKPTVLVWIATKDQGLSCKVFGRIPGIDGCGGMTECSPIEAYQSRCKTLDHRLPIEVGVWGKHIHIGCFSKLADVGLPVPYEGLTSATMIRRAGAACRLVELKLEKGGNLTESAKEQHANATKDKIEQRGLFKSAGKGKSLVEAKAETKSAWLQVL